VGVLSFRRLLLAGAGALLASGAQADECLNVVIAQDHAYAACRGSLLIRHLPTGRLTRFRGTRKEPVQAVDLAAADGFLFTISMRDRLAMYDLADPASPRLLGTARAPSKFFTGIDAGAGRVVVSGGLKGATITEYSSRGLGKPAPLAEAAEFTGRPDVKWIPGSAAGQAPLLVFSLDLAFIRKWGLFILELGADGARPGQVIELEHALAPLNGFDTRTYAPANFPVSIASIGSTLYASHWVTRSIEVIDRDAGAVREAERIALPAVATHLAAEGERLYASFPTVAGKVARITPRTRALEWIPVPGAAKPVGLAVSAEYVAVADQSGSLQAVRLAPAGAR
jgi:hypothetical protein